MQKLMGEVLEGGLGLGGWIGKESLNDRRMDVREASERARNRNEWRTIVTQF